MATETPAKGRPARPDAPPAHDGPRPDPVRSPDPVLTDISTALFHLRRVWAKPDLMKRVRAMTSAGTGGRPLQISNLMVVNAVAALSEAAADPNRADGPPCDEVTVGAVADRLEIDPSTASRLVGHALDAGLLSRRPSPVDARRANLDLTDAGRRVKQVADRFRRAYLNELMSGWTAAERSEFAVLLTRFADAAARAPKYADGIERIFEEAGADRGGD
ncbi:MarR family winged helix-turn-helix transcriptional regulator [Actinomadura chibensis]|uniref:MarR family transcriptional regulator n=1 Tax=Actinomadura chibensis TaxID=392828 RepID=A0A5D0N9J8_9ACTN|nr:MarR family transcriptional regulator [Actinomadura chibensis]TYB40986.1 MarR family transcriptional regulator [Actinomadura chibensis]